MSDFGTAETFAGAERVPVWTRRPLGGFSALAGTAEAGPRFSSWDSPMPPAPVETAPAIDPAVAHGQAIEADAFARGFQEGYGAAAASLAEERDRRDRLADALEALRPAPPADLARMLAETVSRLVHQIVGEVAVDTDRLAERVQSVAALIEEDGGATRLRLHPADIARLDGLAQPLPLVADPGLAEGTIVAEGAAGWIEDGPAIRMDRLRQALDAMAGAR